MAALAVPAIGRNPARDLSGLRRPDKTVRGDRRMEPARDIPAHWAGAYWLSCDVATGLTLPFSASEPEKIAGGFDQKRHHFPPECDAKSQYREDHDCAYNRSPQTCRVLASRGSCGILFPGSSQFRSGFKYRRRMTAAPGQYRHFNLQRGHFY